MTRGSTKAKAIKRACDGCRQRKIYCDADSDQCNWCKHHGLVCTFNRPYRRGRPRGSGKRKIEPSGAQTTPGKTPGSSVTSQDELQTDITAISPVDEALETPVRIAPYGGIHLGGISSFNGIPFFSERAENWIQSKTGSASALRKICAHGSSSHREKLRHTASIPPDNGLELPDRPMVEAYFSDFQASAMRLVLPIIDVPSFGKTIDLAYNSRQGEQSLSVLSAKACIFSFMSLAVLLRGKLSSFPLADSAQYAQKVQWLVPGILREASVDALQTCVMQTVYNIFSGDTEAGAIYHSTACRLVQTLGGHLEPADGPPPPGLEGSWPLKRHIRKLFWFCYRHDKEIYLRLGSPPAIVDDHCNLTLPRDYKQVDDFDDLESGDDLFLSDTRLSIIKSQAVRLLLSVRGLSRSNAEVLRDIRQLDDELEIWRMAIPLWCRPSLAPSYTMTMDPGASKTKKLHTIFIHMEYYALVSMIHTSAGRCPAGATPESEECAGVISSQDIAFQASRSTLVNLQAASQVLSWEDFWIFFLYPMPASLTIFCNFLQNPLHPHAKSATELLVLVPGLLKNMCSRRPGITQIVDVELIERFVAELVRLANCALETAQRDDASRKFAE